MLATRSKRWMAACAALTLLPMAAVAAPAQREPQLPPEYRACIDKIAKTPDVALTDAQAWRARGGGTQADHCAALALFALKDYVSAAQRFEAVARAPADPAAVRAGHFGEAGNAWLLARQGAKAEAALSAGLRLAPANVELLVDRARARAMLKNWAGAEADLTAALARGKRSDIYLLRATAWRALNRMTDARRDIDWAIYLDPRNAQAYVERGSLKLIVGDKQGARRDWLQVLLIAPNGPAADEVRRRIEDLEINPNR